MLGEPVDVNGRQLRLDQGPGIAEEWRQHVGAGFVDPFQGHFLFVVGHLVDVHQFGGALIGIVGEALEGHPKPKYYLNKVEKVDLVYCDVAQEKQSELFMKNMDLFLKEDGQGLITIKARSIDVVQKPKKIFKDESAKIKHHGYSILEKIKLEPYEKDHMAFLVEKSF